VAITIKRGIMMALMDYIEKDWHKEDVRMDYKLGSLIFLFILVVIILLLIYN